MTQKENNKKSDNFKKEFSLLIISLPITRLVKTFIPGVSLAEGLLILLLFYMVLNNKVTFKFKQQFQLILIWMVSLMFSLISYALIGSFPFEVFSRILRTTLYVIVLIFTFDYFDYSLVSKTHKILLYTSSILVIIQFVEYIITGNFFIHRILPFPVYNNGLKAPMISHLGFLRPSGYFLEPSHLSQFFLPGVVLSLFNWGKNKGLDYKSLILFLITIFISGSTNGIVISGIILILFMAYKVYKERNIKVFGFVLIGITTLIVFLYWQNEMFAYIYSKINFSSDETRRMQGIRILRGWEIFKNLPIKYKFIGIGHGNIKNYMLLNNIITTYDPSNIDNLDYVNGLSALVIYYGIPIFLTFLLLLFNMFKNGVIIDKFIIITLLLLMSTSGIDINLIFIYIISFSFFSFEKMKLKKSMKGDNQKMILFEI